MTLFFILVLAGLVLAATATILAVVAISSFKSPRCETRSEPETAAPEPKGQGSLMTAA